MLQMPTVRYNTDSDDDEPEVRRDRAFLRRTRYELWRSQSVERAEKIAKEKLRRDLQRILRAWPESVQRMAAVVQRDYWSGRLSTIEQDRLPAPLYIELRSALYMQEGRLINVLDGIHFEYNRRVDQLYPPFNEGHHPDATLVGTRGMYQFLGIE